MIVVDRLRIHIDACIHHTGNRYAIEGRGQAGTRAMGQIRKSESLVVLYSGPLPKPRCPLLSLWCSETPPCTVAVHANDLIAAPYVRYVK
jgi:hypothetical protein